MERQPKTILFTILLQEGVESYLIRYCDHVACSCNFLSSAAAAAKNRSNTYTSECRALWGERERGHAAEIDI